MNRVGEEGKGESVWLGWFLLKTLERFRADRAKRRRRQARADAWEKHAEDAEAGAGERRPGTANGTGAAAIDDGTPLGSRNSDECQIDSIAQSWSVLSGAGRSGARRARRWTSATQHAGRRRAQDHQAVHAALRQDRRRSRATSRAIRRACARMAGSTPMRRPGSSSRWPRWAGPTRPGAASRMLNPVNHALDEAAAERYRVEPYVVAADIYSTATRAGAAAGPGTPARPAGSIAPRSKPSSASASRATASSSKPVLPSHWDGFARHAATCRRESTGSSVEREDGVEAPVDRGRRQAQSKERHFELADGDGEVEVSVRIAADNRRKSVAQPAADCHCILPQGRHFSLYAQVR